MPIKLKSHNIEPYKKVREAFKEQNKTTIIHAMGTGKTYIGLKLVEDNKDKISLYIAPSMAILHNLRKTIYEEGMTMADFPNLKRVTYRKLAKLSQEEMKALKVDIIIVDEYQYCGANGYGAGIQRLLENNPDAKILGLSATPIRYFDKRRDMTDELFDGNIASELTLEEAIQQGILPKVKYVTGIYGYKEQEKKLQQEIAKINNPERKEQAQNLLNTFHLKLGKQVDNLPELLENHMQEKNGKYIVFCRNIADMKEKMREANQIFGKVNKNITIRGVSSADEDLRRNERTLTEFEKDNSPDTLKLLFSVDMLNEGYHVKDLSGVIMMRPTCSPRIYQQQLGRGLGAGNERETIVIDLVDNYDSCKVIEDFCERMKQYGKGNGNKRKDKISDFSILDNTRDFREVVDKIMQLTRKQTISLDEKITILKRYFELSEPDDELTGDTYFDGYPIGQWAIQIRADYNKGRGNYTEEQISFLTDNKILDRRIEATIDEKIDALIEWKDKHPDIVLSYNSNRYIERYLLANRNMSKEEMEELQQEYKRMQRYLAYLKNRTSRGKLKEEQLEKLRQANFDEQYGYSDEIEQLSLKYRIKPSTIKYILDKYGSMEEFINKYKDGKLHEDFDFLRISFNIDYEKMNEDMLLNNLLSGSQKSKKVEGPIIFYSGKLLNEAINMLPDRTKEIIFGRYGLKNGEIKTLDTLAKEFNVGRQRIRQIEIQGLRALKANIKKFVINLDEETLNEIYNSNAIFYPDEEYKDILCDLDLEILSKRIEERVQTEARRREEEWKRLSEEEKKEIAFDRSIENLELSVRTYNCLTRAGIITIGDLLNYPKEQFYKIRNLGKKGCKEVLRIIEDLKRNGIQEEYGEVSIYGFEQLTPDMPIENLDLSVRTYNCLFRAGIRTIGDLLNYPKEQLPRIRNLGKKCYEEVLQILEDLQINLPQEENEELSEDGWEKLTPGIPIENLDLSLRAFNSLGRVGVKTIDDLHRFTKEDLKRIRNIGRKTYEEILSKLKDWGLYLKECEDDEEYAETELEKARRKREKLQKEESILKEQLTEAEELCDQYIALIGQDDKKPKRDD